MTSARGLRAAVAGLSPAWKIGRSTLRPNVRAAALLPAAHLPQLEFSLYSLAAARESSTSPGRMHQHGERGPPTCDTTAPRLDDEDDQDDDDDDDQAFDASRASLTAGFHKPVYGSTTRRLLHRSAGQLSVRAPPQ